VQLYRASKRADRPATSVPMPVGQIALARLYDLDGTTQQTYPQAKISRQHSGVALEVMPVGG